jgi:transcriptional regulator with XRE-family HTH domain
MSAARYAGVLNRAQWGATRGRRLPGELIPGSAEAASGRIELRYALALGQAVRDRRLALGLSQAEVARRADMTQPQVSRIESGDTVPTLPLLERLARALESELDIHVVPGSAADVCFRSRLGGQVGPDGVPAAAALHAPVLGERRDNAESAS